MSCDNQSTDLDELMRAASEEDRAASGRFLSEVYQQLRAAAQIQMAHEREDHTLQPTALVHEVFLKIGGERRVSWQSRKQFYVAAATAMQQILLDHAKSRNRKKRGGGDKRVALSIADVAEEWNSEEIVSLMEAFRRLESRDPAIAEVVHLRFFAGLSIQQTANALSISPATVKRKWEFGRTWLHRELKRD